MAHLAFLLVLGLLYTISTSIQRYLLLTQRWITIDTTRCWLDSLVIDPHELRLAR